MSHTDKIAYLHDFINTWNYGNLTVAEAHILLRQFYKFRYEQELPAMSAQDLIAMLKCEIYEYVTSTSSGN